MAPEQAKGERELDTRVDIYAIGAILYECLSQRRPHPGNDYNQIIYHILTHRPAPLPETLGPLKPVVEKALERDPEDRFQTADHLRAALVDAARSVSFDGPLAMQSLTSTLTDDDAPFGPANIHPLGGRIPRFVWVPSIILMTVLGTVASLRDWTGRKSPASPGTATAVDPSSLRRANLVPADLISTPQAASLAPLTLGAVVLDTDAADTPARSPERPLMNPRRRRAPSVPNVRQNARADLGPFDRSNPYQ
jgi:serine/threonine-protein kinase